ncbi:MAG: putative DNA binding domain-containing protein, partial [Bacteroidales bacterium]|nr:putative DNA binding domain-containing protein [Bacteroidales bacterium]
MKKLTKLGAQWFYNLLERGECEIIDFKQQLEDKQVFGKPLKNFAPKYEETARDVVAFTNNKGGFLFIGIVDETKEINPDFVYNETKVFDLIKQVQDRTAPTITL